MLLVVICFCLLALTSKVVTRGEEKGATVVIR